MAQLPPRVRVQVHLARRPVHQHDDAARRPLRRHQRIRPCLSPQPTRDLPLARGHQLCLGKLHQLPVPRRAIPDRHHVAACQQRVAGDGPQVAALDAQPQRRPPVHDPRPRRKQRPKRHPHDRARGQDHVRLPATVLLDRHPGPYRAGPGRPRDGKPRRMGRLGPPHQRQVQEDRPHRPRRDMRLPAQLTGDIRRRAIDPRLDPHRLDQRGTGPLDPVDAPAVPRPRAIRQPHDIARSQIGPRRRQREPRRLLRDLRLDQPAGRNCVPLARRQHHRHVAVRHREDLSVRQSRLGGARTIVGTRLDMAQPHPAHHLGRRRTGDLEPADLLGHGKLVFCQHRIHPPVAHDEAQHAVPLHRVEPMRKHQRLQGRPPAFGPADGIAAHDPMQAAHVESRDPGSFTDVAHHIRQRHRAGSAVQPMPPLPGRPVRPEIAPRRKGRVGPRVPCPDMGARQLDHPPAILHGRIVRRIGPIRGHRLDTGRLDRVVPPPVREPGQHRLAAHGIQELVRLVRPLVERRAAVFREPDRLRPRHPGRRIGRPLAILPPVVMPARPPALQVLVAPDPRLALPVRNGRADLRQPMLVAGVVPVIALAAADIGAQVIDIVDVAPMRVEVRLALAPVRQRHVVVDADEIDVLVAPQRVQVEHRLAPARMMAEIL